MFPSASRPSPRDSSYGLLSSVTSPVKRHWRHFPGGPGVKNLPASAGDLGSVPALGILRAVGQLSPCAQLLSPCTTEPLPHNRRSHRNKEFLHCDQRAVAPAHHDQTKALEQQ